MFKKKQNLEILRKRSHKFKEKNFWTLQNSVIDFIKNYPEKNQKVFSKIPNESILLSSYEKISSESNNSNYQFDPKTKESIRKELYRVIPIISKGDVIALLQKILMVNEF
jgi:hypothetical protein